MKFREGPVQEYYHYYSIGVLGVLQFSIKEGIRGEAPGLQEIHCTPVVCLDAVPQNLFQYQDVSTLVLAETTEQPESPR
jgi:hypothetical protein